jgi:hypothetical protein
MWVLRLLTALVPIAALCVLQWPAARAAETDRADPRSVWRKRWTWMLLGYVGLSLAFAMVGYLQVLAQWFSRTQSVTVVTIATVVTHALAITGVILLARWSTRRQATSDESIWRRMVGTRRGIVGLAVAGLLVEWVVVYGTWLGYQQLHWGPEDTRPFFFDWVGWTYMGVTVAGVPVAALCTLLWLDRRRAGDVDPSERIEA